MDCEFSPPTWVGRLPTATIRRLDSFGLRQMGAKRMHIILGATGHVGSACARSLLRQGELVLAVVHDAAKAVALEQHGAKIVVADIGDADALRAIFRKGSRAFLLNPPAAPNTDTDAEERRTVRAILDALDGSGLEKVVAESTMGSQPGERIGDSSVLWALEEGLRAQPIPAAINRAAYYFSNFDMQIDHVRKTGESRPCSRLTSSSRWPHRRTSASSLLGG